jgi:short subunit dehydrogenase-like uncharacterized protein
MTMEPRDFDLVLFGATGTTGRVAAEYLATHAPAGLRVALAGRDLAALESVRRTLGPAAREWPLLRVDSAEPASIEQLARQARVVCTTVGPYAKTHGLSLVEACARHGTHYADITGELPFMRESIDRFDTEARRTGARIVHGCGFDSTPSDLGVYLLHSRLRRSGYSGRLKRVTAAVESMRGGLAPGSLASMLHLMEQRQRDSGARRLSADPYALSPRREQEPDRGPQRDLRRPAYDAWLGEWTLPWLMQGTNTRVVRRTNALLGHAYGRDFLYREVVGLPRGARDLLFGAVNMGLWWLVKSLRWRPVRRLLARRLARTGRGFATELPGHFRTRLVAESEEGVRLSGLITGQGSPGILETGRMLGAAGLCLALDTDRLPEGGGVLTPASGLGLALAERLRTAGVDFTLSLEQPALGEAGRAVLLAPPAPALS